MIREIRLKYIMKKRAAFEDEKNIPDRKIDEVLNIIEEEQKELSKYKELKERQYLNQ